MDPDLNTVLKAAMKLPPEQLRELRQRLERLSSTGETKRGDVRKFFGTFDSGDPNSADNEKIDADLAAAYVDDHDTEN